MSDNKKPKTVNKRKVDGRYNISVSNREDLYDVGKNKPNLATQWSATHQPDPEKQKATKARKKITREIIKEMLSVGYNFANDSQIKKQLVTAFGEGALKLTTFEIMTMQQVQKAILKADTQSYGVLLENALGKLMQPVQNVDGSGNDVRPIILRLPEGMDISLPENTEDDEETK